MTGSLSWFWPCLLKLHIPRPRACSLLSPTWLTSNTEDTTHVYCHVLPFHLPPIEIGAESEPRLCVYSWLYPAMPEAVPGMHSWNFKSCRVTKSSLAQRWSSKFSGLTQKYRRASILGGGGKLWQWYFQFVLTNCFFSLKQDNVEKVVRKQQRREINSMKDEGLDEMVSWSEKMLDRKTEIMMKELKQALGTATSRINKAEMEMVALS